MEDLFLLFLQSLEERNQSQTNTAKESEMTEEEISAEAKVEEAVSAADEISEKEISSTASIDDDTAIEEFSEESAEPISENSDKCSDEESTEAAEKPEAAEAAEKAGLPVSGTLKYRESRKLKKLNIDFPEYAVKDTRKRNLLKCKDIRAGMNPGGCDIRLKRCYDTYLNEEETELALICSEAYMKDTHREQVRFLTERALQYAEFFRTCGEDNKVSLIKGGYLKTFYQLHILRSFAWTLTKWCRQKKRELSDVTAEELSALTDFIEERDGANYNSSVASDTDFCASLRPKYELGKVYTDAAGVLFDKKIVSGDECCVTPDGGSFTPLDSLRADLFILEPAIAKLFDSLINEDLPSSSPASDILFAWCVFSVVCREPFAVVRGPEKLDYDKIEGIPERKTVKVPEADSDGLVIYKNNLIAIKKDKCNTTDFVIPEGVTNILPGTNLHEFLRFDMHPEFYFMESTSRLTIPSTLKNTKELREVLDSLTEMVFSEGVESISDRVCWNASELESIILPETLKSIGEYAFASCSNLKTVTIPQSVEYIHEKAFAYIDSFKGPDAYSFRYQGKIFDFNLYVYKDSFAAGIARERKWYHTVIMTEAQKKEAARIKAEEAERQRLLQAQYEEIKRRNEALQREEAERKRAEEERRKRKAEFDALISAKAEQQKIIAENQGFFKKKTRKAAEEKLAEIESKIKEYPEFGGDNL